MKDYASIYRYELSKAELALEKNDTYVAQQSFGRAGEAMLKYASHRIGMNRKSCLARAAVCFFRGNSYRCVSYAIGKMGIDKKIKEWVKNKWDGRYDLHQMLEIDKSRSKPRFEERFKQRVESAMNRKEWKKVIDMLIDYPYAYKRSELARMRSVCSKGLGQDELAEFFRQDCYMWLCKGE